MIREKVWVSWELLEQACRCAAHTPDPELQMQACKGESRETDSMKQENKGDNSGKDS